MTEINVEDLLYGGGGGALLIILIWFIKHKVSNSSCKIRLLGDKTIGITYGASSPVQKDNEPTNEIITDIENPMPVNDPPVPKRNSITLADAAAAIVNEFQNREN